MYYFLRETFALAYGPDHGPTQFDISIHVTSHENFAHQYLNGAGSWGGSGGWARRGEGGAPSFCLSFVRVRVYEFSNEISKAPLMLTH